jgi:DNA invertase Pin-like site-specific DNA recombinase
MPKYFGYARVSTEEQGTKYSIGVQKKYLEEQAKKLELRFEFFYDTISGSTFNRPGWETMLSIIQPGDILGAVYNDRIGRNTEQSLTIAKELHHKGIKIQVGGVEFDFDNANDELMYTMFAMIGTFQRKNQNKKSREGIEAKKEKGEWIFRGDLFGYNLIKESHGYRVEINESEARILNYIYKEYATGRSIKNICEELNSKGELNRHNTPFYWASVRRWLVKPIYMGYYKEESAGNCIGQDRIKLDENKLIKSKLYPAIVEPSLWKQVNHSYRTLRRTHAKQFEYRYSDYELSGLMKCGHCLKMGYKTSYVHSYHKSEAGKVNSNYVCLVHKTGCGQSWFTFRADVIEHLIRTTYFISFAHSKIVTDLVEEKQNNLTQISGNIVRQIEYYRNEIVQLEVQEKNLIKAIAKGIDSDSLKEEMDNIKKDKKDATEKIINFEKEIRVVSEDIDDLIEDLQELRLLEFIHGGSTIKRKLYMIMVENIKIQNNCLIVQYKTKLTMVVPLIKNRGRKIQNVFEVKVLYQGKYIYSYEYDYKKDYMNFIQRTIEDKFQAEVQYRYKMDFEELKRKIYEFRNIEKTT